MEERCGLAVNERLHFPESGTSALRPALAPAARTLAFLPELAPGETSCYLLERKRA